MFMGKGEFVWFMGVVEDRTNDPLKLGRCKVRCLGFHTKDTTQLPTHDLPWATMMQPITSAAMQGVGQTPLGPVEGTWVVGFFRDGVECQEPIVMGTVGGIPETLAESDGTTGFEDPFGSYPSSELASGHGINEADTNRLARNDGDTDSPAGEAEKELFEHVVLKERREGVETKVPISNNLEYWNEPVTLYDTEYPFNHVKESESGHIEEIDDTPGSERTLKWHRQGTFDEVHPDGTQVTKIVGDSYEIVLQNKYIYIKGIDQSGDLYLTVNGNVYEYIKGNVERQINGSVREIIRGNYSREIFGSSVETVNRHAMNRVKGDWTNMADGVYNLTVEKGIGINSHNGPTTITAKTNMSIVSTEANIGIYAGIDVKMKALTDIILDSNNNFSVRATQDVDITAENDVDITAENDMDISGENDMSIIGENDVLMTADGIFTIVGTTKIDLNPV